MNMRILFKESQTSMAMSFLLFRKRRLLLLRRPQTDLELSLATRVIYHPNRKRDNRYHSFAIVLSLTPHSHLAAALNQAHDIPTRVEEELRKPKALEEEGGEVALEEEEGNMAGVGVEDEKEGHHEMEMEVERKVRKVREDRKEREEMEVDERKEREKREARKERKEREKREVDEREEMVSEQEGDHDEVVETERAERMRQSKARKLERRAKRERKAQKRQAKEGEKEQSRDGPLETGGHKRPSEPIHLEDEPSPKRPRLTSPSVQASTHAQQPHQSGPFETLAVFSTMIQADLARLQHAQERLHSELNEWEATRDKALHLRPSLEMHPEALRGLIRDIEENRRVIESIRAELELVEQDIATLARLSAVVRRDERSLRK